MTAEGLALMRVPFPSNQISKLPKGGVLLDFVGHAAVTDRLLDVDPEWSWEPVALGEDGLPKFDDNGGLWIRLTVCGVTRLGYGDAGTKTGGNAVKEAIGDALRNAGMRFGAALDLWHRGDLHADSEPVERPKALDDPAVLRAGIAAWGRENGRPIPALENAFTTKWPDVTIATASAKVLGEFLEQLRNGEVLVGT